MVDLLERINAMLKQEALHYITQDYLDPNFQQKLSSLDVDSELPPSLLRSQGSVHSASSASSASSSSGITEVWREKICEWSYQVIDHFEFSREVVNISMHFLDRYLASRPVNKKIFQLAAMTSLYIAIKLHEPGRLSMSSMIELSRGYFQWTHMAAMEMSILRTLRWRMHPPTSISFVKHMLLLIPQTSISTKERHDVLELARFLTELGVIDYYFVIHRTSTIALAAILNAIEEISGSNSVSSMLLSKELDKTSNLRCGSEELFACRNRLRLLYAQSGYAHPSTNETRSEAVSPVCVTYGCSHPEVIDAMAWANQKQMQYPTTPNEYRTNGNE